MAEYECYYDVEKEYDINDSCNCDGNKCNCSGNKTIIIHIKTEFTHFCIEYYVLPDTQKKFGQALKYWYKNKDHFNFPGVGAHSLSKIGNLWNLESFKSDGGHAPQYSHIIKLSNPDKIISVIEKIYHDLQ